MYTFKLTTIAQYMENCIYCMFHAYIQEEGDENRRIGGYKHIMMETYTKFQREEGSLDELQGVTI